MAKKSSASKKKTEPVAKAAKAKSTPVRNTPVPKATKVTKTIKSAAASVTAAPTFDQIAKRAYEIYASGVAGSESDHWFRAERELRSGV